MDVHFFSTGADFPYAYYLAVVSALRTQMADRVNIWVAEKPAGRYFEQIKEMAGVSIIDAGVPALPAFISSSGDTEAIKRIRRAHLKDYLGWVTLYEYGGILLDLDTFCLKDLCCTLGDKELATAVYTLWRFGPTLYPFNNSTVIAKPRSVVVKEALDESVKALSQEIKENFRWGISGPMALSNAIHKYYHLVEFLPPGAFGTVIQDATATVNELYREDGTLPETTRVVHLYASSHKVFYEIDSKFIAESNILFARLVRATLSKDDWDID